MVGRGRNGGQTRANNLPAQALDIRFACPPTSECEVQRIGIEMAIPEARIDQKLMYHGGRIVGFAIIFSLKSSEGVWEEQYSVDTKHGHLHSHPDGHKTDAKRDVRQLRSQLDVQDSYDTAYHMVHNRYLDWASGEKR